MKRIKTLIFVSFLASIFTRIFAAGINTAPPPFVATEEDKQELLNYVDAVLSGDVEIEIISSTPELTDEIEKKTDQKEIFTNTPILSDQTKSDERKSAEQYITLLKELEQEIKDIEEEKNLALIKLESAIKAELKTKIDEIESETKQGFTERDADFIARRSTLKKNLTQSVNQRLEQEKTKLILSFEPKISNRLIQKDTLSEELKKIDFSEPCEIVVGEFYRESTPQFFSVQITCKSLDLDYKGKIEISSNDEARALYIYNNKNNFSGRVIYKVDVGNYKKNLMAAEIIDTNDKLIKRFDLSSKNARQDRLAQVRKGIGEGEYAQAITALNALLKTNPNDAEANALLKEVQDKQKSASDAANTAKSSTSSAATKPSTSTAPKTSSSTSSTTSKSTTSSSTSTPSKNKAKSRYEDSICTECIIYVDDNLTGDLKNFHTEIQFLPFCLYKNFYVLKIGGGVIFNFNDGCEIEVLAKNGANFPMLSLEFGTGVIIHKGDFYNTGLVFSTEIDFHITNLIGLNIKCEPVEFSFENSNFNADWKNTIAIGITFSGLLF